MRNVKGDDVTCHSYGYTEDDKQSLKLNGELDFENRSTKLRKKRGVNFGTNLKVQVISKL